MRFNRITEALGPRMSCAELVLLNNSDEVDGLMDGECGFGVCTMQD
jgi:hypothetical protein